MKINSSQSVQQTSYSKNTQSTQIDSQVIAKKDKVEISQEARALSSKVDQSREQKIADLKAQIDSGQYQINPEKTAQSLYKAWKLGDHL
ncbi:flagellar biosynthesis anti-sigma factor FlgM [Bacillus sp. JCM 19041]|uniref:flagellar biosynthesis anti-sigma factor FlgM n=1 Tax=Bacillus sp. JCM 19041 TaxID=1460637 RepID=UPI0006D021EE